MLLELAIIIPSTSTGRPGRKLGIIRHVLVGYRFELDLLEKSPGDELSAILAQPSGSVKE